MISVAHWLCLCSLAECNQLWLSSSMQYNRLALRQTIQLYSLIITQTENFYQLVFRVECNSMGSIVHFCCSCHYMVYNYMDYGLWIIPSTVHGSNLLLTLTRWLNVLTSWLNHFIVFYIPATSIISSLNDFVRN